MGISTKFFALIRQCFKLEITLVLCCFFSVSFLVYAAGPPYLPGETLDPSCAPTSTNCTVITPPTGSGIGTGYITYWNTSSTVSSTPLLFWDNADGWLGVGTSQPSSALHIVGITTLQGLTFTSATGTSLTVTTLKDINGNKYVTSTGSGTVTTSSALIANSLLYATSYNAIAPTSSNTLWDTAYNYINGSSTNLNSVYFIVNNSSTNWNNAWGLLSASSANWTTAYGIVNASSANWTTAFTSVNASSSNWDTAYTRVNASSSNWDTAYAMRATTTIPTSTAVANWNAAYLYVNSSGTNLNSIYNYVNTSGTNWDTAYAMRATTTIPTSTAVANWNTAFSYINASGSNWDAAYLLRATTTIPTLSGARTWTGLNQFDTAGVSSTQLWSSSSTLANLTFTNATGTNLTVTTLLDISGNKYVTSTGNGSIGNVTVPAASVLAGNIPYFTTNASSTLNPTSTLFFNVATGYVGIGTIAPSQKLEVAGNVSSTAICLGGNCQLAWSTTTNWAQNGNNIYNSNTGYVGIGAGMTSPAFTLDVSGTVQVSAVVSSTGITFANATGTGWLTVANASATRFLFVNATGTNLTVTTLKDVSGNAYVTSTPANFTFTNATGSGNLNIGTITGAGLSGNCSTATSSKLLWNSATKQFSCGTDTSIPNVVSYATSTTFNLVVASSTIIDPVSITMTSASNAVLLTMMVQVDGLSATGGEGAITVYRGTSTSSQLVNRFSISNNDLLDMRTNSIVIVDQPATTSVVTYQAWVQYSAPSLANLLDRYVTLQEIQVGADLAETYPITDSSISAGDIVGIDPDNPGEVQKTTDAYDHAAIGIVSTKPAMVIGAASTRPGPVALVALAGRVPVRVSGENGPIKPGDRIAPSSAPGVGMKATKFGRTIGIAMQSFDATDATDRGVIVAFVERGYYLEPGTESLSFALAGQSSEGSSAEIGSTLSIYNFNSDVMYSFENLRAQNLEIGSSAKPSGITIYDTQTKNPYCIIVENGVLKSVPGKCGEGVTTGVISAPSIIVPAANINSTVIVATVSTSDTTSYPADSSSTTVQAEVPVGGEASGTETGVVVDATSTDSATTTDILSVDTSWAAITITPEATSTVTSTTDALASTSTETVGGGQ